MKRFTEWMLFLLLTLISTGAMAQQISNASFENWTKSTLFEYPEHYISTNLQLAAFGGAANVTKSNDAHSGSYALKLNTIAAGGQNIPGGIFSGNSAGNFEVFQGIPYTGRPDSVGGWAKWDIKPGDTAFMMILFKKMGFPIGMCSYNFTGSMANYSYFSEKATFFAPLVTPDSVVIILLSSNMDGNPIEGSMLIADDFKFIGNSAPAFPNGGFESWKEVIIEEPDDWTTLNFAGIVNQNYSASKSIDAYDGSYAIKVQNVAVFEDTIGLITNGLLNENGPYGGMAVDNTPDKITGYYKYIPVGTDTAYAAAILFKFDGTKSNIVDMVSVPLFASNSYQKFELALSYDKFDADTLDLIFSSGPLFFDNTSANPGSALYLDNLSITYKTNGLIDRSEPDISIYPNPAHENIQINTLDKTSEISIFDMNGKLVFQNLKHKINEPVPISGLMPGAYKISIKSANKTYLKTLIIK